MSYQPELKENQIWREVDPRVDREVRILMIEPLKAPKEVLIYCAKTGKVAWVQRKRFNGKRGGYGFVR
jgi:hypothetical protein